LRELYTDFFDVVATQMRWFYIIWFQSVLHCSELMPSAS
jgi:hypothetical protein